MKKKIEHLQTQKIIYKSYQIILKPKIILKERAGMIR